MRGTVNATRQWVFIVSLIVANNGVEAASPATDIVGELNRVCANYNLSNVMVPMRDGTKLYTEIYQPKVGTSPTGILLMRSPYEMVLPGEKCSRRLLAYFDGIRDDGYVIVIQSVRGRYKSEGAFELIPPRHGMHTVDQTTDAWDTVDWLVKNVTNNNGKVAILGISYDGWLSIMAALDPHPAVVAISTQASPLDFWVGDDFWRNGAFRLNYSFEYASKMELSQDQQPFPFDTADTFDWYLRLGPLKNANEHYLHGHSKFWNNVEQHRVHDDFWKPRTPKSQLAAVHVPVLTTAGWWDVEDFYGPINIFKALNSEKSNPNNFRLVIGPWVHAGWTSPWGVTGRTLAKVDFGSDTAAYWRQEVERPWLAHWVLGKPFPDLPPVLSFRTGTNQWMRYEQWPPRPGRGMQDFYLFCDGTIAIKRPTSLEFCQKSYVSDPANPIPYLPRPIGPLFGGENFQRTWPAWQAQDQRFSADRPDTLAFASAPLEEEFVLTGEADLTMHVATTGTDGDFIVKLLDVYPGLLPGEPDLGGYQLMLDHVVIAGRYLKSDIKPRPLKSGQVYELKFHFNGSDHVFLKGHQIAIQIQSSLFPVIARNPQTFVENIFAAKATDYVSARVSVVFNPKEPNVLTLPRD